MGETVRTMDIQVGKYHLRSDAYCMWIDEEYEGETKTGKKKTAAKRVAGYSQNLQNLLTSFTEHKYRASEAKTVAELLKVLKQTEEDLNALKTAALKEDYKILRKLNKEIKDANR